MNKTCSLTFCSLLPGNKSENIGYTRQIAASNVKTAHVLTTITKSVIKDYSVRTVYSASRVHLENNPWTIMTIPTNETIRIQCGTKSERKKYIIRRVKPFSEELLS